MMGYWPISPRLKRPRITGTFDQPNTAEDASALREGLDRHARLQRDLDLLRARAAKEKQINRRVELNTEIRRIETEITNLVKLL